MSLSSQISDSLSLLSIQDDLSTGTSSSAYYSESILSSDSVSHFRVCIFPHIPPTIRFVLPDQRIEGLFSNCSF